MAAPIYSVTLHHFSPKARAASLAFPDEHLPAVTVEQLREMLQVLDGVARNLSRYELSTPEIRIRTDREVHIVRTRYRRLCIAGWETALRGEDHSVAFILTTVTGSTEHVKVAPKAERPPSGSNPAFGAASRRPKVRHNWFKIAVMAVLIIGFNAAAVWLLFRPARSPAPKFVLLPDFESRALLTKVAGEYETGGQEGDRRLIIEATGNLRLAKFGALRSVAEETTRTARGALANGRPALVTNDPYVLAIKDAENVVLYGNTYRRVVR